MAAAPLAAVDARSTCADISCCFMVSLVSPTPGEPYPPCGTATPRRWSGRRSVRSRCARRRLLGRRDTVRGVAAQPVPGQQAGDQAVDHRHQDVAEVVHAAVEPGRADAERDGQADRHDDRAQRWLLDPQRHQREREVEAGGCPGVPAGEAGGRRRVVELLDVRALPVDEQRGEEEDQGLSRDRDQRDHGVPPLPGAPPHDRDDDHADADDADGRTGPGEEERDAVEERRAPGRQPRVEPLLPDAEILERPVGDRPADRQDDQPPHRHREEHADREVAPGLLRRGARLVVTPPGEHRHQLSPSRGW